MDSQQKNTRQRILDAALDIIEQEGMKALTQPRIAKVAGLRQSHLTYYFPRKADLYIALLDASHERAERRSGGIAPSLETILSALFFEAERMRFFLSIVIEVNDDPELQAVLRGHANGLCREIAARTGREPDDTPVAAFVDELRGLDIRAMMDPSLAAQGRELLQALAGKHGLQLA